MADVRAAAEVPAASTTAREAVVQEGGCAPCRLAGGREQAVRRTVLALAGDDAAAAAALSLPTRFCGRGMASLSVVPACLVAGEVAERRGQLVEARAAYARVLEHWDEARPRSLTADAARAGLRRLEPDAPARPSLAEAEPRSRPVRGAVVRWQRRSRHSAARKAAALVVDRRHSNRSPVVGSPQRASHSRIRSFRSADALVMIRTTPKIGLSGGHGRS